MATAISHIQFHYLYREFTFRHRKAVKVFLDKKFAELGRPIEQLNYIFCSDAYLLEINQQYLQHDTLTDIITFELGPKSQPLLSDIYISVERVRENAALFNVAFERELHRVIFHGALHLMGYKDKNRGDKERMRTMEEAYLGEYFVSRSTVSYRNESGLK